MLSWPEKLELLGPYLRTRLMEQVRAVAFIVSYLVLFQLLILRIPIVQAGSIALGLGLVVVGLALFMEGLKLGLMPLGEQLGIKLPGRSPLAGILLFAFVLGLGATFAEPAIGVLRIAGSTVKAWEAPLLYFLLNQRADWLVYAVGCGVGLAVILGMLRFLYNWSLKPLIYTLVPLLLGLSFWCLQDPGLNGILGLAWDCGAVTTGPVTVPLVLALGIGISRVVSGHTTEGAASGFGVVTLASLLPIIAVLCLGLFLRAQVPAPGSADDFFSPAQRQTHQHLFSGEIKMLDHALELAPPSAWLAFFGGDQTALITTLQKRYQMPEDKAFIARQLQRADRPLQLAVLGSTAAVRSLNLPTARHKTAPENMSQQFWSSLLSAAQAILPLTFFLLVIYRLLLRERLPQTDEIFLGIALALIGMSIFQLGIGSGLSRLGSQMGTRLPSAYTALPLPEQKLTLQNFDPGVIQHALRPDGSRVAFFFSEQNQQIQRIQYDPAAHDPVTGQYHYTPSHGPLFRLAGKISGLAVVIVFAFLMGYGATLAEPALNALGATVENLTVGTFKKGLLIQTVGVGVGAGISLGVAKIIWNLPLFWLLAPPYLLLLLLSARSSEQFVNIAWDSAGVTTGPITVPLVLAMGLGIGQQAGVTEGFGILAMASVTPIISVLLVGLYVQYRQQKLLNGEV